VPTVRPNTRHSRPILADRGFALDGVAVEEQVGVDISGLAAGELVALGGQPIAAGPGGSR
jgi:hypothetical protein